MLYYNPSAYNSHGACNSLWLLLLISTTFTSSLRIALQYVREEYHEDTWSMCLLGDLIEHGRKCGVRLYVSAYDMFSRECILHCWLYERHLQLPFHMLPIDELLMVKLANNKIRIYLSLCVGFNPHTSHTAIRCGMPTISFPHEDVQEHENE